MLLGNADGAFIQAVAEGEAAWPTFNDALRAHALADAIYRSADLGGDAVAMRRVDA